MKKKNLLFVYEQRNIDTWLYVTLPEHITIRPILKKNQSIRSEPQDIQLARHVITTKLPCQSRCFQRNIVESLNSSKINLVVTYTADCTCHHLTNRQKKLKFPGELSNSKQIRKFKDRKCCSTW